MPARARVVFASVLVLVFTSVEPPPERSPSRPRRRPTGA